MPRYMGMLRDKAFQSIPGAAYNRYRQEAEARPGPKRLYYEVPLMETRPWAYLRDRVFPAFCRYLKYKKLDPESGQHVVVALFHENQCHLIHGPDVLEVFRQMEGLDATAFRLRLRQWLSSTAQKTEPPPLPLLGSNASTASQRADKE